MPLPPFDRPAEILAYAREQLLAAVSDPKHDWHWPQLATSDRGVPATRVVVLREFDVSAPSFTFFTDRRAAKVAAIKTLPDEPAGPTCEACFYDRTDRIQLRVAGLAVWRSEGQRRRIWTGMKTRGKLSYATAEAPGSELSEAGDGLTDSWREGAPTAREDERAFGNFLACDVRVTGAQFLQLSDAGQRRGTWDKWSESSFAWLVP